MDYGLLGGIAEGIKSGIGSYQDISRYKQDMEAKRQDAALRKRMADLQGVDAYAKLSEAVGSDQANSMANQMGLLGDYGVKESGLIPSEPRGMLPQGAPSKWDKSQISEANKRNEKEQETGIHTEWNPQKQKFETSTAEIGSGEKLRRSKISAEIDSLRGKTNKAPKGFVKQYNQETGQEELVPQLKPLPADKVLYMNEGNTIPAQLQDVKATLENNANAFGPIGGRLSSMNPYDERARTIRAQLEASSQTFGKYMEGGILKKEDEEKYRKMFPQLSDTIEVANNKLAIANRMLVKKQASNIAAMKASGYDISGVNQHFDTPDVPKVLLGEKSGTSPLPGVPSAQAGSKPNFRAMSPADLQKYLKTGTMSGAQ